MEPLQFQNGDHYFEKHPGRFASETEETRRELQETVLAPTTKRAPIKHRRLILTSASGALGAHDLKH
jgi:hypothetical protein